MTVSEIAQTEAEFQAAVIELAQLSGWRVAHFADSRREVVNKRTGERRLVGDNLAGGFPDLVLVRDDRIIFAELKAAKGRTSRKQDEWFAALSPVAEASCHVEVHVWKPADWPEIEQGLARGRA